MTRREALTMIKQIADGVEYPETLTPEAARIASRAIEARGNLDAKECMIMDCACPYSVLECPECGAFITWQMAKRKDA